MPRAIVELKKEFNNVNEKIDNIKFPWWIFLFITLSIFLLMLFFWMQGLDLSLKSIDSSIIFYYGGSFLIVSSIYSFIISGAIFLIKKEVLKKNRQRLMSNILATEAHDLTKNLKDDFFSTLLRINLKHFDNYYLQTQMHSDRSFLLTSSVSLLGFILLLFGVLLLFFKSDSNSGMIVAGIGLISEFIASIFFWLYTNTTRGMNNYHQKLVLSQNIYLALKLSSELEGDSQVQAKLNIVDSLMNRINDHLNSSSKQFLDDKKNKSSESNQ